MLTDNCPQYSAIISDGGTDVNNQPCPFFDLSCGEEQIIRLFGQFSAFLWPWFLDMIKGVGNFS